MSKEDKRIIQEDIRDLENLLLFYSKTDNDYKVAEIEKEIRKLKEAVRKK